MTRHLDHSTCLRRLGCSSTWDYGLAAHALSFQTRHIKYLALPPFDALPSAKRRPFRHRPRQGSHPWLYIPSNLQRDISPFLQLTRNICDLIFRLCILQLDYSWLYLLLDLLRRGGFLAFALDGLLGRVVDVLDVLERIERMTLRMRVDDLIPNDCF